MKKLQKIERSLKLDPEKTKNKIMDFIKRKVNEAGANGVLLGLSGGLDSATAAYLCSKALEKEKVMAIFMPERSMTDPENAEDAREIANKLGIEIKEVEISPILESLHEEIDYDENAKLANANLKPRTRMVVLYYYANLKNYLVIGSSNKSELKCGYFTKYGDGAVDILPLGSLYKTQVEVLASNIGVPEKIIQKKPTAELWRGQTDEDELGLSYKEIDRIYAGLEVGLIKEEIAEALTIKESKIEEFMKRKQNSRHKVERIPTPNL